MQVFVEGTTAAGKPQKSQGGAEVDPEASKVEVGGVDLERRGWSRLSTIHTHHVGGRNEFSNEHGIGRNEGDIPYAIDENIRLYLVAPNNRILKFDPAKYEENLERWNDGTPFNHEEASKKATSPVYYLQNKKPKEIDKESFYPEQGQ